MQISVKNWAFCFLLFLSFSWERGVKGRMKITLDQQVMVALIGTCISKEALHEMDRAQKKNQVRERTPGEREQHVRKGTGGRGFIIALWPLAGQGVSKDLSSRHGVL